MKIAIATFGERVSPRFDCAPAFIVVTVEDGRYSKGQPLSTSEWAPHDRINRLVELGVDTIVCGGIDWWSAESLRSADIRIYSQVTGEIDEALATLVRGDLHAATVSGDVRDQAEGEL
jgi:predicted Fe-Mo cluster-binding NifX family protein